MLLILDGNNLAHRCKHVFALSVKGKDVSVTYGFIRVTNSIISKYKPTSVLVCWDMGIPDFRRQAVPEYKANRHKDDDPEAYADFLRQMDELIDYALPMMGIISVRKEGAEADDLMFHASRICLEKSIIVSTDKDMLQAISTKVSVLNPFKDMLYTHSNAEEKLPIAIKDYVSWRAIQGDGSDNIPGIMGIGEIIATKLFKEYDDLSGIVNAALGNHKKVMSDRVARNICEFGIDRISKNVVAMSLEHDRVGAREAVLEAVEDFQPANKDRMKRYFMANAFVSLMDGEVYRNMLSLQKPKFSDVGIRVPMIVKRRVAVE